MAAMAGSLEEEEARIAAERTAPESPAPAMSNPAVDRAKVAVRSEDRQATRLIPTNQIRMSPISDRMDAGEDIEELIESIREEGQQVPIMVRRLPDGELEVVYGRRRLLACRALKIDVRASVNDMTDEEALIAQGVENNRRKDSSFIEKAMFVMRIIDAGYKAVVVQRATGVNETTISKMRAIINEIPKELILRIGPAHGAGRPQWDALKALCKTQGTVRAKDLVDTIPSELPSLDRLYFAITALKTSRSAAPPEQPGGSPLKTQLRGKKLTLVADDDAYRDFLTYLDREMPRLLKAWEEDRQ
jgi:ParB family chromosome partitioning protein